MGIGRCILGCDQNYHNFEKEGFWGKNEDTQAYIYISEIFVKLKNKNETDYVYINVCRKYKEWERIIIVYFLLFKGRCKGC